MSFQSAPSTPYRFGNYVLLSAFARGGMGDLFLAKSETSGGLDRLCVVKKLRPDVTLRKEYVNRFVDEARVVLHLNHSNICSVYDFGQVDEEYYLAMEHIAGLNLQYIYHALKDEGRTLQTPIAIYIMCEVLDALQYAHDLHHPIDGHHLHLVHRDVSPQNILVSFEGDTKLIDFGLARSELKIEQTDSAVVMGKVAYMSPEQARGEAVGPASDQYAAAVVLYELLSGERFFGKMPHDEIWSTVGKKSFTPEHWDQIDGSVQVVLKQALSFEPSKRFASAGEFRDALDMVLKRNYPSLSRKRLRTFMQQHFKHEKQKEKQYIQALSKLAKSLSEQDIENKSGEYKLAEFHRTVEFPAHQVTQETVTQVKQPVVTIAEFDKIMDAPVDLENFEQTDRIRRPVHKNKWIMPAASVVLTFVVGVGAYWSASKSERNSEPVPLRAAAASVQEQAIGDKEGAQNKTDQIDAEEVAEDATQGSAKQKKNPAEPETQATDRKRAKATTKKRHTQPTSQTGHDTNPIAYRAKPAEVSSGTKNLSNDSDSSSSHKTTRASVIRQLGKCQAPCAKILISTLSRNIEAPIPKTAHYTIAQCQKTCSN